MEAEEDLSLAALPFSSNSGEIFFFPFFSLEMKEKNPRGGRVLDKRAKI